MTGAQQGIGRAIAVALARDGANVAINFLDDEAAATRVAGEERGHGRQALLVPGDVSRPGVVEAMVAAVVRTLGPPDVVVNNAGVFPRVAFLEMKEGDWDHVLDVNLKGTSGGPGGARAMVAAGRAGAIVTSPPPPSAAMSRCAYSASKAGVIGLTRAMALAWRPPHPRQRD